MRHTVACPIRTSYYTRGIDPGDGGAKGIHAAGIGVAEIGENPITVSIAVWRIVVVPIRTGYYAGGINPPRHRSRQ
jgi:hypothetical protein